MDQNIGGGGSKNRIINISLLTDLYENSLMHYRRRYENEKNKYNIGGRCMVKLYGWPHQFISYDNNKKKN